MEKLDLAYWKSTYANFMSKKYKTVFTHRMILHARKMIHRIESKILVKTACLLMMGLLSSAGCNETVSRVTDPLPNTGRGFWQDIAGTAAVMVEHHEGNIYRNSVTDIPRMLQQTEDRLTWMERMKARLKAMQGEKK